MYWPSRASVVSICSVSDRKPMPRFRRTAIVAIRWGRERPGRSSRQTAREPPGRASANTSSQDAF